MLSVKSKIKVAARFVAPVAIILAVGAAPTASFAAGPASQARSLGGMVTHIFEGERTMAPFASVVFCMQQPDQCKDNGGEEIVALDSSHKAELLNVNASVNHAIRPVNDAPGTDVWSVDVAQGDCEDYALTKRKHLLALGWSSKALRIAVARTPSGEGHAVLIARTSEGDLVLDNRTSRIKDWRSTDLTWVMFQSEHGSQQWVRLTTGRPTLTTVADADPAPSTAEVVTTDVPVTLHGPIVANSTYAYQEHRAK
jgi:predicted transglutaminase-like cysteine proteinase